MNLLLFLQLFLSLNVISVLAAVGCYVDDPACPSGTECTGSLVNANDQTCMPLPAVAPIPITAVTIDQVAVVSAPSMEVLEGATISLTSRTPKSKNRQQIFTEAFIASLPDAAKLGLEVGTLSTIYFNSEEHHDESKQIHANENLEPLTNLRIVSPLTTHASQHLEKIQEVNYGLVKYQLKWPCNSGYFPEEVRNSCSNSGTQTFKENLEAFFRLPATRDDLAVARNHGLRAIDLYFYK